MSVYTYNYICKILRKLIRNLQHLNEGIFLLKDTKDEATLCSEQETFNTIEVPIAPV